MPHALHGRLRRLADLKGIGPALERRFHALGLHWIEDLLALPPGAEVGIGEIVDGVTPEALRDWFLPQARFLRLPGVGEQFAAALVTLGHRHYADLVLAGTDALERDLARIPEPPTPIPGADALRAIQLASARRMMTATVIFKVRDGSGAPLRDAEVTIGGAGLRGGVRAIRGRTTSLGRAIAEAVPPDVVARPIQVRAEGFETFESLILARPGSVEIVPVELPLLSPGPRRDARAERSEGPIGVLSGRELRRTRRLGSLDEVSDGSPWAVSELDGTGPTAVLVGLHRKVSGLEVETTIVRVPRQSLPTGVRTADVVRRVGSSLQLVDADEARALWSRGFPTEAIRNGGIV